MESTIVLDQKRLMSVPVMKCCLINDSPGLFELIQADPTSVNFCHAKSKDSPLIISARYAHFEVLKLLVENGANIFHRNIDGKQALHEAAYSGCKDCAAYLLNSGLQVDTLKRADWTPLMIAACQNHLEVVRLLIETGSDINRLNKDGWNAFHLACREGHIETLEHLYNVDDRTANTVSKNGRTPLHTACMHGQLDAVIFLLKLASCNPDQKDSCGSTPLMDAFRFGFVDIATRLLDSNICSLHEVDKLGRSCFLIAAQSGQLGCVQLLLKKYTVDVNLKSAGDQRTALHLACKEGHTNVVEYLLFSGADINLVDNCGRTALHLATAASHVETVRLLLRQHADLTIIDVNHKVASDYTAKETVKRLFEV